MSRPDRRSDASPPRELPEHAHINLSLLYDGARPTRRGHSTPVSRPLMNDSEPVYLHHGDLLWRLRVWSEVEWSRLEDRPAVARRVPGLGWIGAVLVRTLGGVPPAPTTSDRRRTNRRGPPTAGGLAHADQRRSERRRSDRRRFDRPAVITTLPAPDVPTMLLGIQPSLSRNEFGMASPGFPWYHPLDP